jgi:hypothetical protein
MTIAKPLMAKPGWRRCKQCGTAAEFPSRCSCEQDDLDRAVDRILRNAITEAQTIQTRARELAEAHGYEVVA